MSCGMQRNTTLGATPVGSSSGRQRQHLGHRRHVRSSRGRLHVLHLQYHQCLKRGSFALPFAREQVLAEVLAEALAGGASASERPTEPRDADQWHPLCHQSGDSCRHSTRRGRSRAPCTDIGRYRSTRRRWEPSVADKRARRTCRPFRPASSAVPTRDQHKRAGRLCGSARRRHRSAWRWLAQIHATSARVSRRCARSGCKASHPCMTWSRPTSHDRHLHVA